MLYFEAPFDCQGVFGVMGLIKTRYNNSKHTDPNILFKVFSLLQKRNSFSILKNVKALYI